MSIYVDKDTKVIVQGITGSAGVDHTEQMLKYGTKIVGGVTPGKGGETVLHVPTFNKFDEAVKDTGATGWFIYVPSRFAAATIMEARAAVMDLTSCITEHIPAVDMIKVTNYLEVKKTPSNGTNC